MQLRCCSARSLGFVWPSQCRAAFSRTSPVLHSGLTNVQERQHRPRCSAGTDFHVDPVVFSRVFVSWPAKLAAAKRPEAIPPARMGRKRAASDSEEKVAKAAKPGALVNPLRWRSVKEGDVGNGPVLYWMSRDQRMLDNWALLHAAEVAKEKGSKIAVCFNLVDAYLEAGARQFGFMLRGLEKLAPELEQANIRFYFLRGDPGDTVPSLVSELDAGLLVVDQAPLRLPRKWKEDVKGAIECPMHEVDAHNIIPVWHASDKKEHAARTIRPKIQKQMPKFLEQFPELPAMPAWDGEPPSIDWASIIAEVTERGKDVPEVAGFPSGEAAAHNALSGDKGFLTPGRLKKYDTERNNPTKPQHLSNLSPYFHFGQLSVQRVALEIREHKKSAPAAVDTFLEEAVVRRELSDNFCFYEPNYDNIECAAVWARDTLKLHEKDKREHIYSREQMEKSKTHDDLWNAAQKEMVHLGKMHGYLRMYWAKKILEWTKTAEEAIEIAIYLNDKYELDGRDPNGYVGVMWSMVGIHDRGWTEREIFGKIRFMNYNGCKRKFDIQGYIMSVDKRTREEKKAAAALR